MTIKSSLEVAAGWLPNYICHYIYGGFLHTEAVHLIFQIHTSAVQLLICFMDFELLMIRKLANAYVRILLFFSLNYFF